MEAIAKISNSPFLSSSSSSRRRQFPAANTQPSFIKLVPSLSSPLKFKHLSISIKSSSLSNPCYPVLYKNPKSKPPSSIMIPSPIRILKTAFITALTAVTVFFFGHSRHKPVLAAALPAAALQDASTLSEEEIESIRDEMDYKFRNCIFPSEPESQQVLNQLLRIEPEVRKWQHLKAHMLAYQGHHDAARTVFTEIIKENSLTHDAYRCLIDYTCPLTPEWDEINNLIEASKNSEDMKSFDDPGIFITFMMVYAAYHKRAGIYKESVRIYDELINKYPQDYRGYFCKAALLTFLDEKEEAEEYFRKCMNLVPDYQDKQMVYDRINRIKALPDKGN